MSEATLLMPGMCSATSGAYDADATSRTISLAMMPSWAECGCIRVTSDRVETLSDLTVSNTLLPHHLVDHSLSATSIANASKACWSRQLAASCSDKIDLSLAEIASEKKDVIFPFSSRIPPIPNGEASVVIMTLVPSEIRLNR